MNEDVAITIAKEAIIRTATFLQANFDNETNSELIINLHRYIQVYVNALVENPYSKNSNYNK